MCCNVINVLLFNQISPVDGPPAGGTKVTISGENLGVGVTDTYISIGGQECLINDVDRFIRHVFYTVSQKTFTCLFFK